MYYKNAEEKEHIFSVFHEEVKVNLHSIRFSSAFVHFCTFFLLHEKICSLFAFLCPYPH